MNINLSASNFNNTSDLSVSETSPLNPNAQENQISLPLRAPSDDLTALSNLGQSSFATGLGLSLSQEQFGRRFSGIQDTSSIMDSMLPGTENHNNSSETIRVRSAFHFIRNRIFGDNIQNFNVVNEIALNPPHSDESYHSVLSNNDSSLSAGYLNIRNVANIIQNERVGSNSEFSMLEHIRIILTNLSQYQRTIISQNERNGNLNPNLSRRRTRFNNSNKLKKCLPMWIDRSQESHDFSFLTSGNKFTDSQRNQICRWLGHLETSKDFIVKTQELAALVCNIIETLRVSDEFRSAFFLNLNDNLVACGDRSAMLLNLIYTDWKLITMSSDKSDADKIRFMAGIAKTLTLRNVLQYKLKDIVSRDESVEIMLYYEKELKEELGLETAIKTMIHEAIGNRSEIERGYLTDKVKTTYLYTLINFSAMNKIFEKSKDYLSEMSQLEQEANVEMEKADEDEQISEQLYIQTVNGIRDKKEADIISLKLKYFHKMEV